MIREKGGEWMPIRIEDLKVGKAYELLAAKGVVYPAKWRIRRGRRVFVVTLVPLKGTNHETKA